jgi:hypothetical protein
MKFSDGVIIETSGELRMESHKGDLFVVGRGFLCYVDSNEEGEELIRKLKETK